MHESPKASSSRLTICDAQGRRATLEGAPADLLRRLIAAGRLHVSEFSPSDFRTLAAIQEVVVTTWSEWPRVDPRTGDKWLRILYPVQIVETVKEEEAVA